MVAAIEVALGDHLGDDRQFRAQIAGPLAQRPRDQLSRVAAEALADERRLGRQSRGSTDQGNLSRRPGIDERQQLHPLAEGREPLGDFPCDDAAHAQTGHPERSGWLDLEHLGHERVGDGFRALPGWLLAVEAH